MQINGSSLSTVFIPKGQGAREPIRPPVTIDAEPTRARAARTSLAATTEASPFQTALMTAEDEQQQNFVRLFADAVRNEELQFNDDEPLPRSVQQYVQIANLNTEPQQRLFDALV
jgi:hypothetical protein